MALCKFLFLSIFGCRLIEKTDINMQMSTIEWKKGIFSSMYTFFHQGKEIGYLKQRTWNNNADAFFMDKSYEFVTKGFFKQKTIIMDKSLNIQIGEIVYDGWTNRSAEIKLNDGRTFLMKYTNFWNTKWKITNLSDFEINYNQKTSKGFAEFSKLDELVFLAGIYISNYFTIMTSAVIVSSITISASAISVSLSS